MIRTIGTLMTAGNNAPVVFTPCADAAVIAFLAATGISDSTIENALCTLVAAAKANGWWTLCNAIYPMVGGTSTTCAYNLRDTSLYQISFNGGGWSFASTGATPNGSTSYGDTGLDPTGVLTEDDTHMSYYSRSNTSNDAVDIGAASGGINRMQLQIRYTDDNMYSAMYTAAQEISSSNTDGRGCFMTSRININSHSQYKNGVNQVTNTVADTGGLPGSRNIYVGALNSIAGGPSNFSNKECAFATIGAGISDAVAATMYTDIQAFQTALSRNV